MIGKGIGVRFASRIGRLNLFCTALPLLNAADQMAARLADKEGRGHRWNLLVMRSGDVNAGGVGIRRQFCRHFSDVLFRRPRGLLGQPLASDVMPFRELNAPDLHCLGACVRMPPCLEFRDSGGNVRIRHRHFVLVIAHA